jgi:hypothetical protein
MDRSSNPSKHQSITLSRVDATRQMGDAVLGRVVERPLRRTRRCDRFWPNGDILRARALAAPASYC